MNKLKKIRVEDILAIFKFVIAFVISKIYRKKYKNLWLICESGFEARDNGYWLFKYIKENYPEQNVAFVITKESPDIKKIQEIGDYVEYKTLRHWIMYLSADANISSHKAGNPNAAVCYVLEVYFNMSKNRVFLQHGITLSNAEWLYYKNTKFRKFICGAAPEYDYIKNKFGYPDNNLDYVGFTRFDSLEDTSSESQIIIMPSWRNWLVNHSDNVEVTKKEVEDFKKSDYFKYWMNFLSNKKLIDICKKNDVKIGFFPHRNMQPYLELFEGSPYIELISWKDADIQDLLKKSSLLITDYSSVSLDFSYMNKPVIYYQFDISEFRERQYAEGYFDYEHDGFGPLVRTPNEAIVIIEEIINENFKNNQKYSKKISTFFELKDKKNCERTFEVINEMVLEKE